MAGVRFKAWKPSEAPHPSLLIQTPLVFDPRTAFGKPLLAAVDTMWHPGVEIIKILYQ